jgi:tRNA(Ile2) C34 agmatinyltransferase TiaS
MHLKKTNKLDKEYGRSMSSKEKKEYRCEQCGINFDSLEAFTQHDKEKHIE